MLLALGGRGSVLLALGGRGSVLLALGGRGSVLLALCERGSVLLALGERGSVLLIFLVVCVMFFYFACPRNVHCVPKIASVSGLSILGCSFGFL